MAQSTSTPSTHVLSAAANLLRKLTPSALGMLAVIAENTNEKQTQGEIATAVGRSQSRVSEYRTDLEEATPPLAMQRGQRFVVTETGAKLIDLIATITAPLGLDFASIEWTDEDAKETIETHLTPLHDSRTIVPICILDSLADRSEINSPHDDPAEVWIDDILHDVERRRAETDEIEDISMEQIRRSIRLRFVETDTADFDHSQVALTEKGVLHAWLLNEFTQFLEGQEDIETLAHEQSDEPASPDTSSATADRTAPHDMTHPSNARSYRDSGPRLPSLTPQTTQSDMQISEHVATPVPVYRLQTGDAEHDEPDLILPITISIEDLIDRARQLSYEHDPRTELVLDWMMQTESGLSPVRLTPDSSTIPQSINPSNSGRE